MSNTIRSGTASTEAALPNGLTDIYELDLLVGGVSDRKLSRPKVMKHEEASQAFRVNRLRHMPCVRRAAESTRSHFVRADGAARILKASG